LKLSLNGYIKNKGDAGVEILLEGKKKNIEKFMLDLKNNLPPLAHIYKIITKKIEGKNQHKEFKISQSSLNTELSGSILPPDISICKECLKELKDKNNRRYDYFFITCTNCGPRYTIINNLPYDRENTTMKDFPTCIDCRKEYSSPLDRRFHAQTIACDKCGPKIYLTSSEGKALFYNDPIREAGKLISEGFIVAIKGYGGFHVATSTIKDEPIYRLKKVKHRRQKPFAVMAKNYELIKTFAEVNHKEKHILTSNIRPIVLVRKSNDYYLSDLIAPGLHNIGVMLPYTGIHHILFDKVTDPAFVMTSANPPNQPIIIYNFNAIQKLGKTVDYLLLNNRKIAYRCDDSVIRVHKKNIVLLRRSRGITPTPIILKQKAKNCVLAIGGELNNTVCILFKNKVFVSQHIGDVETIEIRNFLINTINHIINLTKSKIDIIACDLHPKFITTKLAKDIAERNKWRFLQVQHHHAHLVALMAEKNLRDLVGLCCDGYGYGIDGEAWGGEILLSNRSLYPSFKRLGHLEKQPLVGGDLATIYPIRIAIGALYNKVNLERGLKQNELSLPYGGKELNIIYSQLQEKSKLHYTSSCGRILDAIAAILGICYKRTYEGEPAMKLESIASKGKDVLKLEPQIRNNVLMTTPLLQRIFEIRQEYSKSDLAYSAHIYLAKGLAELGIENATNHGVKTIGFSGGVACNEILTSKIKEITENSSINFVVHNKIPPGDGGICLGQAIVGGFSNF
jgi:hydrogenase maturation protein HypF